MWVLERRKNAAWPPHVALSKITGDEIYYLQQRERPSTFFSNEWTSRFAVNFEISAKF